MHKRKTSPPAAFWPADLQIGEKSKPDSPLFGQLHFGQADECTCFLNALLFRDFGKVNCSIAAEGAA
jgi:hypothetical protein